MPETGCRLSDEELVELRDRGIFLRDNFLGREAALAVHAAVVGELAGELRPAGIGRGSGFRREEGKRGDIIAWLEPTAAAPPLAVLHGKFEALRRSLNREAFLGLDHFEVQVALYPGNGARYVRHRDAFHGGPNRRLTSIWYANPDWRPEHAGELRLYLPDGEVDVSPVLDRLVVFLSDRIEHEVLPTWAPRWAVTAWYRGIETFRVAS